MRDGKRSTFDLAFRDDDIASNQALQERMRGDFGIGLPDVPETDNWLPSAYFSAVAAAISSKRRWSIDTEGVEIGFYSSSKFLIMRDLEPANWPGNALVEHKLVRGLLFEGLASAPPLLPEDAKLDAFLHPADLVHVVDAEFIANPRHRKRAGRPQSHCAWAAGNRQIANHHQYDRRRRACRQIGSFRRRKNGGAQCRP